MTTRNVEEIYQIQNAFGVFGYFFTETEIALIFTLQPETCNDAKQLIPTLVQEGRQTDEEELGKLLHFVNNITELVAAATAGFAARVAYAERMQRYAAAQKAGKSPEEQEEERRETYHESWFPEPEAEA